MSPHNEGPGGAAVRHSGRAPLHIPSLDGIRAASFMVVFISHTLGRVPGGFGVTVFFFLSGYLITTLLRMEYDASGTVSLSKFYLRRVLRILPPFYIVLAGAALLAATGLLPHGIQPGPTLAQALHFGNYWMVFCGVDGQAAGTAVYWSLAVEEHFYLVFPLAYLLLRRYRPCPVQQAAAIGYALMIVLAWRCVLVYGAGVPLDRTYLASDTRVDSILWGCLLAIYGNPVLDTVRGKAIWWKALWFPCGMVVLAITFVFGDDQFRETWRYSLQGAALVPIFIAAIQYPSWGPFWILNLRPVAFLGTLSYSAYLMHHVLVYLLWPHLHLAPAANAAIVLAVTVVCATVSYWLVERPCAELRRRLSARKREGVAPAAVAAPPVPSEAAEA